MIPMYCIVWYEGISRVSASGAIQGHHGPGHHGPLVILSRRSNKVPFRVMGHVCIHFNTIFRDLLESITVPVYAHTSPQVASPFTQDVVPAALATQSAPQPLPQFNAEAKYRPNNHIPRVHFQSPPLTSSSPSPAPVPVQLAPQHPSQVNIAEYQYNNQTQHLYLEPPPLPPTPPPAPPKGYLQEKQGQSRSALSRSPLKPFISRSHSFKESNFQRQDPLRSSLPVRVYKAHPPIKAQLLPVNMPLTTKPIQRLHSMKYEPMTSLPDGVHQPIIIESSDKEG